MMSRRAGVESYTITPIWPDSEPIQLVGRGGKGSFIHLLAGDGPCRSNVRCLAGYS
jgi:hypothetical protein